MLPTIIIRRKFLGEIKESRTNQGFVTSTPIKKKSLAQPGIEFSPVEKNSPNTHGNHFLEPSYVQEVAMPNNIDDKPESEEAKQLIVMDSDEEEEFWQNRKKPIKKRQNMRNNSDGSSIDTVCLSKRIKIQKQVDTTKTKPSVDAIVTIESQNHGIILPKITVDTNTDVPSLEKAVKAETPPVALPAKKEKKQNSKSGSKILKNLERDELSEDSNQPTNFKPLRERVGKPSEDDGSLIRRSNRQRSKPLEFWNGERMEITRDFSSGIVVNKKNLAKRKKSNVPSMEIELEQSHQISKKTSNLENTHKLEANLSIKSDGKKKRKSILKSKTGTRSKTNVRFSAIGTGTTIDGPTRKSNIKPDWVVNFPGIHSTRELVRDSENCVVLPGLNTVMGTISSAVMQIRPKSINQSQAPDLHHLMYCVMVGTVTVTIDETSVQMEACGHFAVPCGVSYSIKNIGKQSAILSFFKVACSCTISN